MVFPDRRDGASQRPAGRRARPAGHTVGAMRSSGSAELLSLDRDLPTTAEDVATLARACALGPKGLAASLSFLAGFPPPPGALGGRRGSSAAPFELMPPGRSDGL